MGIIQCAEECKYQIDGYCYLENCSTVASVEGDCPHFEPKSFDNANGLFKTGGSYKL